jgi:cardiolipin synthase
VARARRKGQRRLRTLVAGGVLVTGLGAAACARVPPHLALPALVLGEPSFFPTLEAYASAPIVAGNAVEILLNGEQIFPALLDAVRSARRTITYAQYFYEDGPVARDLVDALAERARAGIGVNVLLDAFGSLGMPAHYAEVLKRAGCHVAYARPLGRFARIGEANQRNHRRILVVDGRVGFTGGSGVSRKWMGDGRTQNHWRDTDVRVSGPAVEYLQAAFAESWLDATGMVLGGEAYFPRPIPPAGRVHAQFVRSSPAGGSSAVYTTFLLAIASAKRSIYITNPYFVLDDSMQNALVRAVRRGVRTVVLVPGVIDHNLVRQASRGKLGGMLKAGVVIHEYQAALLHAKTMVIDGVWATIGSTNLDNRSFALNDELNLIVYDRGVAQRLEAVFMEDLVRSRALTYQEWAGRGLRERVLELLARPVRDQL